MKGFRSHREIKREGREGERRISTLRLRHVAAPADRRCRRRCAYVEQSAPSFPRMHLRSFLLGFGGTSRSEEPLVGLLFWRLAFGRFLSGWR